MKHKGVQSKSKPSNEESSSLPQDILESIELTVLHRKSLGLFDDREERIQRALRYQEFINGRFNHT
jgi:hypothetical protein